MRTPSLSSSCARARSRTSSRSVPHRATTASARASGLNSRNRRGLAIPPTITARLTPASLSAWMMPSSWPACTQVIPSTTSLNAGSVSPMCATATTPTPRRPAVSAKSTGKRPLPAMSPIRSIRLPADPPGRGLEEGEQALDLRNPGQLRTHLCHVLAPAATGVKQHTIGAAQRPDRGLREPAPPQPHDVQAEEPGPVAGSDAERRHVLRYHGPRRAQRGLPEADELVHAGQTTHDCMALDRDVPRQRHAVRQDHRVVEATVVGDVRRHHEQAPAPDHRLHPAALRTGVDRDVLAHDVRLAENQRARLA